MERLDQISTFKVSADPKVCYTPASGLKTSRDSTWIKIHCICFHTCMRSGGESFTTSGVGRMSTFFCLRMRVLLWLCFVRVCATFHSGRCLTFKNWVQNKEQNFLLRPCFFLEIRLWGERTFIVQSVFLIKNHTVSWDDINISVLFSSLCLSLNRRFFAGTSLWCSLCTCKEQQHWAPSPADTLTVGLLVLISFLPSHPSITPSLQSLY